MVASSFQFRMGLILVSSSASMVRLVSTSGGASRDPEDLIYIQDPIFTRSNLVEKESGKGLLFSSLTLWLSDGVQCAFDPLVTAVHQYLDVLSAAMLYPANSDGASYSTPGPVISLIYEVCSRHLHCL